MTTPNAIGIDLSYTATGIAWGNNDVDVFTTDPQTDDIVRAERIALDVMAHTMTADLVAIEAGVYRSNYAFRAGILHGLVRHWLHMHRPDTRVVMIPAKTLKVYAAGNGNADKTAMVVAAHERLGYDALEHNEADALWLRAIGMAMLGHPVTELPQTHTRALDKLQPLERQP